MSDETIHSTDYRVTNGAEAVIAALERDGVEYLFGVQGSAIMPVYDALYHSEMHHVTMAHEQGAAHASDAYNIASGDPGVCLATSGPGATNLVTGLADSFMDSEAVLALTGQAPSHFLGKDAFQEVDTVRMIWPVTKHNDIATDPDTVGTQVSEALHRASSRCPGPTLVDLAKDITNAETEVSAEDIPERAVPPRADASIVDNAVAVLADADRPIILAGGCVIKADAASELQEFATNFGLPVVTTMPGIGSFPEDHDLAMEVAGMHGTGYANMAVSMTDCLLAVGTRFDDRLTGGVDSFAPDTQVLHIGIDPSEFSKNIRADIELCGDAGVVLEQLSVAMPHRSSTKKWVEQCLTWKEIYPLDYAAPDDESLKPQYVVEQLDSTTPDDTIVTTGVGQHQMWAFQYWTYLKPRTWVSSHGLGQWGMDCRRPSARSLPPPVLRSSA